MGRPHRRGDTTIAEACSLIAAPGAQNIRVCPDTFHINIKASSWRDSHTAAGPLLGNVQVSDNDRGMPGRGMIHFAAVFQSLAEIDFSGTLVLESFAVTGPGFPAASCCREPSCTPKQLLAEAVPVLRAARVKAGLA